MNLKNLLAQVFSPEGEKSELFTELHKIVSTGSQ